MTKFTQKIIQFNSEVWNRKKETISDITNKPLSLKDPIKIKIPQELESFGRDLVAMHNIVGDTQS
jgi:valyl-tRNA synthetase